MKHCPTCERQFENKSTVCAYCGTPLQHINGTKATEKHSSGSFLFWILGFCFPTIGFLIYLAYKDDHIGRSRSARAGAFVGCIAALCFNLVALAIPLLIILLYLFIVLISFIIVALMIILGVIPILSL